MVNEQFGYAYDAAGNLQFRTSNAMVRTLNVDSLNQLTTATRTNTMTVAGLTTSAATSVTVNGSAATRYDDKTFAKDGVSPSDGMNTTTKKLTRIRKQLMARYFCRRMAHLRSFRQAIGIIASRSMPMLSPQATCSYQETMGGCRRSRSRIEQRYSVEL